MTSLLKDVLDLMLGVGVPFRPLVWLLVTLVFLLVGPFVVTVSPRLMDPPGVLLAARPERVAAWLGGSLLMTFAAIFFLAITIVGAPAVFLVPVYVTLATIGGFFAFARVVGHGLLRRYASIDSPVAWQSVLVGIVVLRLTRVLPFVGAAAFSLVLWIGFAAMSAVAWDRLRSWHRRRMPDKRQFQGETLVEWYPAGDPADGRPSVGTGTPVVGNVRGDEVDPILRLEDD
ncbi:MAG: hypothetical protein JWN72_1395 [Thermoleophilia bacterium]|nr:hypothetical protein [Thermoleophilia bacterium]